MMILIVIKITVASPPSPPIIEYRYKKIKAMYAIDDADKCH